MSDVADQVIAQNQAKIDAANRLCEERGREAHTAVDRLADAHDMRAALAAELVAEGVAADPSLAGTALSGEEAAVLVRYIDQYGTGADELMLSVLRKCKEAA